MQFDEHVKSCLAGHSFSEDLVVRYEFDEEDFRYQSRFDLLAQVCCGKHVVHVGCVDHSVEMIERKRAAGTWLHQVIADVAARCHGIDIAEKGIAYMRDVLRYDDVEAIDISSETNAVYMQQMWDVVLLPEVLEHIGDPVAFLSTIHSRFSGCAGELIVTVPNAMSRANGLLAKEGRERINSDHRFWFTPYTVAKVLSDGGFSVRTIRFTNSGPLKRMSSLHRWYYEKHPAKRNCLIAVADF